MLVGEILAWRAYQYIGRRRRCLVHRGEGAGVCLSVMKAWQGGGRGRPDPDLTVGSYSKDLFGFENLSRQRSQEVLAW